MTINYSDSETKHNTHKEKIKMNEKMSKRNAIPSKIFPISWKTLFIWQKDRRGQQKTFPFLFKTLIGMPGMLRANGCHCFVLCM